jgi:hypothetical protein
MAPLADSGLYFMSRHIIYRRSLNMLFSKLIRLSVPISMTSSLLLLTLPACLPGPVSAESPVREINVRSYPDTQSAGWAYKKSDYAFVAEFEGCRIQWNATESNQAGSKKYLSAIRNCSLPFKQQLPIHRAILKEIFAKWPASDFDSISWGRFAGDSDHAWSMPVAIASASSKEYRDYRMHYPNSRTLNINTLFVKLANETDAYHELRLLFMELGATIELSAVEKVFVSTARDLPFFDILNKHGISSGARLMYDAAFSYFRFRR